MSILSVTDVLTFMGKNATASDAERGKLQMLIPLAESALKKFIGYNPEQQAYTEFYPDSDQFSVDDGTIDVINDRVITGGQMSDSNIIPLINLPVRSISSVYEDAAAYGGQGASDFASNTLRTAGVDYYLDVGHSGYSATGFLIRIGTCWPSRRRTVKVTYTAGFSAAELDGSDSKINAEALKYAALLTAIAAFQESDTWSSSGGPIQAETISTSAHSVTYASEAGSIITGMILKMPPKAQALALPFKRFRP